ncbi:MAG TPA: DUF2851 family protein [Chthoniobacter sp.]
MNLAHRYEQLRNGAVREEPLLSVPRQWSELEVQAHWFAGDFGRDFVTTTGQSVRIVQFGVWNREAGPDFAEAAVSFGGAGRTGGGPDRTEEDPQRGSIEIDLDARDWERHGHATNPHYESVVLHIHTRPSGPEFFTRTAAHRLVPQVFLDLNQLSGDLAPTVPEAKLGRCSGPLRELPDDKVREVLLGAAQFRLRRKAGALARLAELHGPDEALYQALAATLGYKNNKLPFTLLAQRLPLRLLRKLEAGGPAVVRASCLPPEESRLEARTTIRLAAPGPSRTGSRLGLLFGVSGFLPHDLGALDPQTRSYLRTVWEKWWPRRAEFERLEIAPDLWCMSGQRPMNHPQRRLAALAEMVALWPKLRALADRCEPGELHEFFADLTDDYWDFHYTVTSKTAARRMALVGESRVTEMLANVFFPLAVAQNEARWADFKKLRAPLANQRVEVAALRLFGESVRKAEFLRSVALQQGLLQIYEDFCLRDATDCARCPFPRQLAGW